MKADGFIGKYSGWLLPVAWLSASLLVSTFFSSSALAATIKPDPSDAFFTNAPVRVFKFDIPETQLNILRRNPKTYVRGAVREGTTVLNEVAIRLKGMGSFRPVDDKPSLAVKFDHFIPGQEYAGLTKLMFNNSAQDLSYLAEYLATGLFRDAGLPAAR